MKRVVVVTAALLIGVSLAGCGARSGGTASQPTPAASFSAPATASTPVSAADPLAGIAGDLTTAGDAAQQAGQDASDGDAASAHDDN